MRRPSGVNEMPRRTIASVGQVGDVVAVELDPALADPGHTHDAGEGAGLPGPVRAEQRHHLAVTDLERHALDRVDRAVADGHPLDAQHSWSRQPVGSGTNSGTISVTS